MLRKLMSLYENAILFASKPEHPSDEHYLFFDELQNEWLSIPKHEVNEPELTLLKTLFKMPESEPRYHSEEAVGWYDFLLNNGPVLALGLGSAFRFIQFYMQGFVVDRKELESALKGFFSDKVMIIWEDEHFGVVIEEKKPVTLSEKEIISLSETLESDFYAKISFYIGKFHPYSEQLPDLYKQEKTYFRFGQKVLRDIHLFTFERIFPAYAADRLPDELKLEIKREIKEAFQEDAEMFSTIKAFLENNLNASTTAKKLYIHRNTLQYRIDKFVEKTGIGFKDFYGAFTVFLACLIFEQETRK